MQIVRLILFLLAAAYIALFLYAFFFAEGAIFYPPPSSYRDDERVIKLTSSHGVKISALYFNNPRARYTILYSHGNAEDIGENVPWFERLRDLGFSVFAYDYQGYGTSEGRPTEQHVYDDIEAAYSYLTGEVGVPASRIIAIGQSVGGGAAIDLASKRPLAGVVTQSTFTSAFRVVTRIPILPFDHFHNISKIGKIHSPVLIVHGKRDRVIPFAHGATLFAAANQPKRFFWSERAGHNDLFLLEGKNYERQLLDFAAWIDKQTSEAAAR